MTLEKPQSVTLLSLAEQSAKVLALLATTLLIISVCYDYTFLMAVGLTFNEIPSLTTEHVRSALLWGPYMALVIAGAALNELILRRLEDGLSEEEIRRGLSSRAQRFRDSPPKMALAILSISTVVTFFTSTGYTWVYMALIIGWIVLSVSIIRHKRMGQGFTRVGGVLFGLLPVVFALVGWQGHIQGNKLLSGATPSWELTIRVGTATTKQALIGLRRFSTFAIAVDQHHFISIIPNDAILSARLLTKAAPQLSNLCRWFNRGCPQATIAPPSNKQSAQPRPSPKPNASPTPGPNPSSTSTP
jgi:hypothetical protein